MWKQLTYWKYMRKMKNTRYRNLIETVYKNRCKSIMEIGTFNGSNANKMIITANIFYPKNQIYYYGFDLFEDLTKEDFEKEFSKKPPTYEEVQYRLKNTGANIYLYKGYTKNTLPQFIKEIKHKNKKIDFVFIDGGHSIETIALDWSYVKKKLNPKTIVIFDDYYNNDVKDVKGIGCQFLINSLDKNKYEIKILEPEEQFQKEWGILRINMVKVKIKK